MILDVDSIATDADLAVEIGGTENLNRAQKSVAIRDAQRASALVDIIRGLAARTPPIQEGDLVDTSELKMAVVYRALNKICAVAVTEDGDRHHVLAKKYDVDFRNAMAGTFSVSPGVQGPGGNSFGWERC